MLPLRLILPLQRKKTKWSRVDRLRFLCIWLAFCSRVYGGSGAPPKICARTFPKSQIAEIAPPKICARTFPKSQNRKSPKSQIAEIANRRNRKSPKSQISKIANRKSTKSQVYLCDRKPRLFCHLGEYTV